MSDTEQEYWQLWNHKERLEAENELHKGALVQLHRDRAELEVENKRLLELLDKSHSLLGHNFPSFDKHLLRKEIRVVLGKESGDG